MDAGPLQGLADADGNIADADENITDIWRMLMIWRMVHDLADGNDLVDGNDLWQMEFQVGQGIPAVSHRRFSKYSDGNGEGPI